MSPIRKMSGLMSHAPSLGTNMSTPSSARLIDSLGFWNAHGHYWLICQSGTHSTWHRWNHSSPRQRKSGPRHKYPLDRDWKSAEESDKKDPTTQWCGNVLQGQASSLKPSASNLWLGTQGYGLFYKCLHNFTDLNVKDFVSFACCGRTRLSSPCSLVTPLQCM